MTEALCTPALLESPSTMSLQQQLDQSRDFLAAQWKGQRPDVALILGSGLGGIVNDWPLQNRVTIPYAEIPHFPVSTVVGHGSELLLGQWPSSNPAKPGLNVAVLKGRFHYYEGYSQQQVVYPLRALRWWGAQRVIVTNAAGGLDPDFRSGDWMLITDQLNLTGTSPLIGPNPEFLGPRFFDMGQPFHGQWRQAIATFAQTQALSLRQGVYAGLSGPAYETHAEVRWLQQLGAQAVGMSTVAEVLAARHMGMEVLGLSCITNPAAGVQPTQGGQEQPSTPLNHEEVVAMGSNPQVIARGSQLLQQGLYWAARHPLPAPSRTSY